LLKFVLYRFDKPKISPNIVQLCGVTLCDSAGVIYWGDASTQRIEAANTDGSGRKVIMTEHKDHYYAFAFHAGIIYYTNWRTPYVLLLAISRISPRVGLFF